MAKAQANGIEIEYETLGDPRHRPLVLIMGLGSQLIAWHEEFCEKLVAKGHHVIRFDSRDVGLSTKMDDVGIIDIMKLIASYEKGQSVSSPYLLSDMAKDTVGLMDNLGIDKAHICGLSMGGMVAQTVAIEHPGRVLSLISMESSTSELDLPSGTPEAMDAMFRSPPLKRDRYIEHMGQVYRVFSGGSSKYDENLEKRMAALSFDRSFYPFGFTRQFAAMVVSGGRRNALRSVVAPSLVLHGSKDTLVPPEHGKDTADAMPGAKFIVVEGLGHGLSYPALWDEIVDEISEFTINAQKSC
jgi:pimeloyl-ACP methyl ester carboxylesterase